MVGGFAMSPTKEEYRKQAAELSKTATEIIHQVLIKHHMGVLEGVYEELQESRKDAERYRFLKALHNGGHEQWFVYAASSDDLDADIDAAMLKARKEAP
jgi:hypothetical protein